MGRAAMPVQLVRIKVQNTMENIEKIVSHYRRYQAGCAKRRAEIDGEIAKLQEERKHLNELRWTEGLIRPVMAEIAHLTPEIEWEQDKEYHPMGLRCAVPVFGRLKSSSQLLGITFTELGGELTEEQKSAADSYAQQLMDNYGDTYTANGIGLETLKLFQQLQYKHTLLLDLVYGKDGETPVEDGELTEHLDSTMYEIGFITVPLYNTSTFAFASDDQKAEMLSLAQKAADSYNANAPEDTSSQLTAFNSIASSALTGICAVLDAEVPSTSTLQTDLLSESDLTDAFTQEGAADTLRGLAYGQAAAIQYSGYALMLAVRLDPLGVSTLDALRSQILSDLKGEELDDALAAYGAQLDNSLSSSAMGKLPAAKIVNDTSANSANS